MTSTIKLFGFTNYQVARGINEIADEEAGLVRQRPLHIGPLMFVGGMGEYGGPYNITISCGNTRVLSWCDKRPPEWEMARTQVLDATIAAATRIIVNAGIARKEADYIIGIAGEQRAVDIQNIINMTLGGAGYD